MPKSEWQYIADTPAAWIRVRSEQSGGCHGLKGPWDAVVMHGSIQGYLHRDRKEFVPIRNVTAASHAGGVKQ